MLATIFKNKNKKVREPIKDYLSLRQYLVCVSPVMTLEDGCKARKI